ncbi:MAG TPA: cyclic nucleotide-binding domain-containing protein, partial [Vicinamibacteria bacterium]|nr:cyclic nucleotide-binding domain-containing protein [Vicinamibacteria bacterium]
PDLPQLLRTITAAGGSLLQPEQREALEGLRLVGFLSGLAPHDLDELALGARMEHRRRGDVLFKVGDPGDRLYLIRRGAVEIESAGGVRTLLKPPSHFGEMSAVTGEPRTLSARVAEDADLLAIESRSFRSVLLKNPFLALELANALSGSEPPAKP